MGVPRGSKIQGYSWRFSYRPRGFKEVSVAFQGVLGGLMVITKIFHGVSGYL